METILQGIPGVTVYIDDILVTGRTKAEHLGNLKEVLSRLAKAGMLPTVENLGYIISADGLPPNPDKVKAIVEAPEPTTVLQLRSFLGLLT